MKSEILTDEQLFRGIARNTNVMAALIHQQLELEPTANTLADTIRQVKLRESNAGRIGKIERNYREYTAELRRRYSLDLSGSDAATVTAALGRLVATTP